MILTGSEIALAVRRRQIIIEPFDEARLNPNSFNYTLGDTIYEVATGSQGRDGLVAVSASNGRVLLEAGKLYLGHTAERIGSDSYVTSLIGRSSVGRLGLFLQVSANLGHRGSVHRWTLELVPALDIYVYPGQIIGQVSFWTTHGETLDYDGWYGQ